MAQLGRPGQGIRDWGSVRGHHCQAPGGAQLSGTKGLLKKDPEVKFW